MGKTLYEGAHGAAQAIPTAPGLCIRTWLLCLQADKAEHNLNTALNRTGRHGTRVHVCWRQSSAACQSWAGTARSNSQAVSTRCLHVEVQRQRRRVCTQVRLVPAVLLLQDHPKKEMQGLAAPLGCGRCHSGIRGTKAGGRDEMAKRATRQA